jgi:hypothetical protein
MARDRRDHDAERTLGRSARRAVDFSRAVQLRMAISRHDKNKGPSVSGPRGLCARTFDQLCSVTRLDYSDGMVNES